MRTRAVLAIVVAALVAVLVAGCSGSSGTGEPEGVAPTGTAAAAPSSDAGSTPPEDGPSGPAITPPFALELEESTASSARIGPGGGTLEVTGPGTTYRLDVPPGALLETVKITGVPVAAFGDGNTAALGVVFQPSGLSFLGDVTLTMTTDGEIPVDRQLLFEFSDDGEEVVAADAVLDDAGLVVHVGHFSGYGFADLADSVRERWTGWRTERREAELQNGVRDLLGAERMNQLLGLEGDPDLNEKLIEAAKKYENEVVRRRLANADTSCDAAKKAVASALGLMRQQALLGLPSANPDDPLTYAGVLGVLMKPCEKDAIARCKAARDPRILLDFWSGANTLLPGTFVIDSTRADLVCDPKAYQVVGGLQSFQVSEEVCNVMEPFSLDSDIGSMELSGGLSGTYEFTGDFDAHYTGTYSISFPHGPRKPGTMTGHGSGTVAGQGGSGTEKFTLTPIGPAC